MYGTSARMKNRGCREVAVSRGLAVCYWDFDHFFFVKNVLKLIIIMFFSQ